MAGTTYIGKNGSYTITRELGKGGEGQVYELANNPTLVLKLYNEELSRSKIEKLRLMVNIATAQIETYAAWPKDIVADKHGKPCGFVMKKLAGYVPLHNLFSPMDRKKLFPDKGYNFLAHVARNLSTAFYALHNAGLVVGDVNEGNILVNGQGMVAFIDCDSFQVKDGNSYHFCEVGVPRYTPPELLVKSSFEKEIRTENTDSFSMAVLIFQLLFLGRHPFAGKNNSREDIDEETAIKNHWFAYSLQANHGKLLPPNDSLPLKSLSEGVQSLFHQAFEKVNDRPLPTKWIAALDGFIKTLLNCSVSSIHIYPPSFNSCPWCAFKERRNILYFLEDNSFQNIPDMQDIESFINGFKVEKLSFPKLQLNNPAQLASLVPMPIDKKFIAYKNYIRAAYGLIAVVFVASIVVGNTTVIPNWIIFSIIIWGISVHFVLPWKRKLKVELATRKDNYLQLKKKLDDAIKSYNQPPELVIYKQVTEQIEGLINRFKNLPKELVARQKEMEERVYDDQLNVFLASFNIINHNIPALGTARKAALFMAGIDTAADVNKLQTRKVQGIGTKFIQVLFSWQRQISSGFVYRPDNKLLLDEYKAIVAEMAQLKKQLELDIKAAYKAINIAKTSFINKQSQLQIYIIILQKQVLQAELDYNAFAGISRKWWD